MNIFQVTSRGDRQSMGDENLDFKTRAKVVSRSRQKCFLQELSGNVWLQATN